MKIIRVPSAAFRWSDGCRRKEETVGFVPTMGALHLGHLSLMERARRENDRVAVSIFVNPTQFGPREDFSRYPRPFTRDVRFCRAAGVDLLFAPSPRVIYDPDFQTWVQVERLSGPLCGRFRPGHFRGVATVVLKLLNVLQPHRAYFGEKDFQQLRVIQRMVRDLNVPVRIVPCPTVREPDGLARSSRNAHLTAEDRGAAPLLALALREGAQVLQSRRNVRSARERVLAVLRRFPRARVQYVEIIDSRRLIPWKPEAGSARIAAAVHLGSTRLIDNVRVNIPARRSG